MPLPILVSILIPSPIPKSVPDFRRSLMASSHAPTEIFTVDSKNVFGWEELTAGETLFQNVIECFDVVDDAESKTSNEEEKKTARRKKVFSKRRSSLREQQLSSKFKDNVVAVVVIVIRRFIVCQQARTRMSPSHKKLEKMWIVDATDFVTCRLETKEANSWSLLILCFFENHGSVVPEISEKPTARTSGVINFLTLLN